MMEAANLTARFHGVWPTMVTPFDENLKIDYDGVAALVDWYLENRVDGIFALCQSSEMFFLSPREGQELTRFVVRRVDGRVPVVVSGHTSEDAVRQADELAALAAEGPDAVVLLTNRFFGEGEEPCPAPAGSMPGTASVGLASGSVPGSASGTGGAAAGTPRPEPRKTHTDGWLSRLDRLTDRLGDIRLGMYECPYPYRRSVTPGEIAHMAKDPRFVFFKDTCCDYGQFTEKLAAARGGRLALFNANSALLLDTLRAGADGFCGVMGNIHPLLYHYLDRCWRNGALGAQIERLNDFLAVASAVEARIYPVCAKYYLSLLGLPVMPYARSKDHTLFSGANAAEMRGLLRLSREFENEWNGIAGDAPRAY